MRKFALIYDIDNNTILGSDQLIRLDGRLSTYNCIEEAKKCAKRLLKIRPLIYSIRVYQGTLRNNRPISNFHVISHQ